MTDAHGSVDPVTVQVIDRGEGARQYFAMVRNAAESWRGPLHVSAIHVIKDAPTVRDPERLG